MVRAERVSRFRVLTGSSVTFSSAQSDGQFSRSQIGTENGAPRRHAGAELFASHEGELARGKRIRPLRTLAARLTVLHGNTNLLSTSVHVFADARADARRGRYVETRFRCLSADAARR